jgi:ABC-2 type transport system permease protein
MAFIAAGFMGMGVFWSSITRNQIIAFILTVVCMILMVLPLFIMGNIEGDQQASAKKLEFIKFVSYLFHLREAGEGKLQVRYLLFHGSQAVLWLFLTVKVLEARKWR